MTGLEHLSALAEVVYRRANDGQPLDLSEDFTPLTGFVIPELKVSEG